MNSNLTGADLIAGSLSREAPCADPWSKPQIPECNEFIGQCHHRRCNPHDHLRRAIADTRFCAQPEGDPRARQSDSYVQIGRMQSVVPDSLGISVSLAGRN